ncbi:MAG: hypothetical protein Q9226_005558 [Calogaya cf. arnoldii]
MPHDEFIRLNYATRLSIYEFEKPYQIISEIAGAHKKSNVEFRVAPEPECIQDLRGQEHLYGTDSHGFKVFEHRSAVVNWTEKRAIEAQYIPEVKRLLADHMNEVDEVYVFNWRKRKNRPYQDVGIQEIDLEDGRQYVLPADFVHIDQSPAAVLQEVQFHMGERAAELLRGRVRVVKYGKCSLNLR